MSGELIVLMGNQVAGILVRESGGRLHFRYDDDYRSLPDQTPLSISMPIENQLHDGATVRNWLWGLLPDNEAVLRRWAKTFQVSASGPFSLLSSPVGEDCAGAVRFVRPERLLAAQTSEDDVEWLEEKDVAARLRDLRADATTWLGSDSSGQFSLAGAQAKTALLFHDGRWGVPTGNIPTSHILKPAIAGLDDHDLNEHLCLRAAHACGMKTAVSTMATFEDQPVLVITRYDRVPQANDFPLRVHQEDLCQALGVGPEQKYQADNGPTSTDITNILRAEVTASNGNTDADRFVDALIFNWVIGGTDAHAKNYSLLLSGSQVRLAPLYDLGSALPYPHMHIRKLRMAMEFGGSYDLLARDQTMWGRVAAEVGLTEDAVTSRATVLIDHIDDALSDAVSDPAVRALGSPLPTRLLNAVTRRAAECRATLGRARLA